MWSTRQRCPSCPQPSRPASVAPDRHRRAIAECLMKATTVVEGDPVCDSCLGLAAVGIALEIDVLMLERPPEPLDADQRRDLLEIVEDRYEARSIIITSQLPVDRWYEIIGNPTMADAILDRLVHNAYRIELKG